MTETETETETETVDVVVVGLGPGGEDVAGRLAEAGLQVVAIEAELVGGECPYWGCIPSKMVIRAADLLAEARRVEGMAGDAEVHPRFAPVARRIRDEATDTWDDTVAVQRLEGKGARLVRGWGRLDGPGRVVVDDQAFEATRAVVVGIGTRAAIPPIAGLADTPYWTNRELVEAEELPASLCVLGGGAIGVELAQALSRFGVAVTVVESAPRLVVQEEPETSELLTTVLGREGVQVIVGAVVTQVRHELDRFVLDVEGRESIQSGRLLVATGRRANLAGLGVESIGLDERLRALPVDDHLRVDGVDRTWAVGDVTGKGAFTHVSMYQADVVVNDILGEPVTPADYRAVPRVTFTDPELGSVGMSEQAARDAGIEVVVGHASVPSSARGWIHKAGNDGLIKLVGDAARGVLVGATSMGPWGGEVLSMLTLAVHAEVPLSTLRHLHYAYPTFHRAIGDAMKDLLAVD